MTESQRHEMAREKVRKLKLFYIHLVLYLLVNTCLFTINIVNKPDKLWFYWVLIGWGIGVLGHAAGVFAGGIGKTWEERKIKEILEKEDPEKSARS